MSNNILKNDCVLEVVNLSKSFGYGSGKRSVLREVSFSIEMGKPLCWGEY